MKKLKLFIYIQQLCYCYMCADCLPHTKGATQQPVRRVKLRRNLLFIFLCLSRAISILQIFINISNAVFKFIEISFSCLESLACLLYTHTHTHTNSQYIKSLFQSQNKESRLEKFRQRFQFSHYERLEMKIINIC